MGWDRLRSFADRARSGAHGIREDQSLQRPRGSPFFPVGALSANLPPPDVRNARDGSLAVEVPAAAHDPHEAEATEWLSERLLDPVVTPAAAT